MPLPKLLGGWLLNLAGGFLGINTVFSTCFSWPVILPIFRHIGKTVTEVLPHEEAHF